MLCIGVIHLDFSSFSDLSLLHDMKLRLLRRSETLVQHPTPSFGNCGKPAGEDLVSLLEENTVLDTKLYFG